MVKDGSTGHTIQQPFFLESALWYDMEIIHIQKGDDDDNLT